MSLAHRIFVVGLGLAALTGCSRDPSPVLADRVVDWLYTGALDSLRSRSTPELRIRLEERGGLEVLYTRVVQRLIPETQELEKTVFRRGAVTHAVRTVRYAQDPERPRTLWIAVDEDGRLHRLALRLADEDLCREDSPRPRITLRLPFQGAWTVLHGGPLREQNVHALDPQLCYAAEWIVMEKGLSYRGGGEDNHDYLAYGLEVLAPASGVVAALETSVPENVPGKPNYGRPRGNYLVLDHRTGEFSVLAGLQGSSVTLSVGDTVAAGQTVGRCGNNGLSREPKVHLRLQSGPEESLSLPMRFTQVRVDGERRAFVVPRAGQVTESLWLGSTSAAQD